MCKPICFRQDFRTPRSRSWSAIYHNTFYPVLYYDYIHFFGFKNVGLGDLVGYLIGAIAIGIGWYVREPIGDFIAYFIILVQRPLKIGDFIKLDNETFGFVRKITPRAVIIRKKTAPLLLFRMPIS